MKKLLVNAEQTVGRNNPRIRSTIKPEAVARNLGSLVLMISRKSPILPGSEQSQAIKAVELLGQMGGRQAFDILNLINAKTSGAIQEAASREIGKKEAGIP